MTFKHLAHSFSSLWLPHVSLSSGWVWGLESWHLKSSIQSIINSNPQPLHVLLDVTYASSSWSSTLLFFPLTHIAFSLKVKFMPQGKERLLSLSSQTGSAMTGENLNGLHKTTATSFSHVMIRHASVGINWAINLVSLHLYFHPLCGGVNMKCLPKLGITFLGLPLKDWNKFSGHKKKHYFIFLYISK